LADEEAARRVLAELPSSLPEAPSLVWSSLAARCRGPASRVACALGLPHRQDPLLAELDQGAWEGLPWEVIEQNFPEHYRAWMADWKNLSPPGGEGVAGIEARARRWLSALPQEGTHLLLAHAGFVRAMWVVTQGIDWETAMSRHVPHLEPILLDAEPALFTKPTPGPPMRPPG
jgi:alpha-ribazole phosphatase